MRAFAARPWTRRLRAGPQLSPNRRTARAAGRRTVEALLVAAARPRLERVGVHVPEHREDNSGRALYALLEAQLGNRAHSRYDALTRRLLSHCSARAQDARRRR